MISVQGLTKQYGLQRLFDDVTFSLLKGERLGLVGRNGHGKSTIFRIIIGEETPDSGEVIIPRGYRIGHLSQHLVFTEKTVRDEAALGLHELEKDAVWKVETILIGLGFSLSDLDRSPHEFSGGYQMRIVLAKTLVSEPDLLLLDEPTNFLDIISIRWLEEFLSTWKGEMIIITHDRRFMDKIVTHIMGIHRGKLRKYPGKTAHYYEQLAQDEEVYEKRRLNEEKRVKQMTEFVNKFRAKARQASLAQSRLKALQKLEPKEKLEEIESLGFSFPYAPLPPKTIIRIDGLSFSYSGKEPYLINDFNFEIDTGEKVCIIGRNGTGKTTLIKLIDGILTPQAGVIKKNPHCKIAYYEQGNTADLNPDNTIEKELLSVADTGDAARVRSVCGGMMFSGDLAFKKIKVLSGGEKCRVMLGKLLVSKHNVLLLDEPSHHLDMESCDAIIDAVTRFDGSAIIVTHDERFLHEVATKLIVFTGHGVRFFPGTYQEFLEQIGWEEEGGVRRDALSGSEPKMVIKPKASKRERAEFIQERGRLMKPIEERMKKIEKDIAHKERALEERNNEFLSASQSGDGKRISEISKEVHALKTDIDKDYDLLEAATKESERLKSQFEKRADELGI